MAIGDDALAAGMQIVDGNSTQANTIDTEINLSRDYIAQRTSAITPLEKGGTGASNADAARANLGVPSTADLATKVAYSDTAAPGVATPNKLAAYDSAGRLATAAPASAEDAVPLGTLQGGFTTFGDVFLPNSSAATSGYTIAYINVDGRVSRGASSERYKKYITEVDPADLGDIFPALHRFQMRQGDGEWKYGWIAERLAEDDDTAGFVVYNDQGEPDSIDFIALLIAQNAQLHQAVGLLTQRLDALEDQS